MSTSFEGLRYRGKDTLIKTQFHQFIENEKEKKKNLERTPFSSSAPPSITEHPYYNTPPKGKKVSHAYEYERTKLLNRMLTVLMPLKKHIKVISDRMETLYGQLSKENKELVNTIAKRLVSRKVGKILTSKLGIASIPFALSLMLGEAGVAMALDTGTAAATAEATGSTGADAEIGTGGEYLLNLFFHEGAPENSRSICFNLQNPFFIEGASPPTTLETLCQEFHISASKEAQEEVLVQGAYSMSSINPSHSLDYFKKITESCGSESQLKGLITELMEKGGKDVLGSSTCQISSFSEGRTVNINYALSGVSEKVCTSLHQHGKNILRPCMNSKINPISASAATSNPLFYFLMFLGVFAGTTLSACAAYSAYKRYRNQNAVAPVAALVPPPAPPPIVIPTAAAAVAVALPPAAPAPAPAPVGVPHSVRSSEADVSIDIRSESAAVGITESPGENEPLLGEAPGMDLSSDIELGSSKTTRRFL